MRPILFCSCIYQYASTAVFPINALHLDCISYITCITIRAIVDVGVCIGGNKNNCMRDIGRQHIVRAGGTNWKKKVYGVKLSKKNLL